MCAVIIGMSSGTSFAFDPLPATQSATGPQLSPQHSQWIMGNCNAYVLKSAWQHLTQGRTIQWWVRGVEQKKMWGGKVEQIFDLRLGIESGTVKMAFQTYETEANGLHDFTQQYVALQLSQGLRVSLHFYEGQQELLTNWANLWDTNSRCLKQIPCCYLC